MTVILWQIRVTECNAAYYALITSQSCLIQLFLNEECWLQQVGQEVMVDVACGMAVLRGADVFVQGIMAASPGKSDLFEETWKNIACGICFMK